MSISTTSAGDDYRRRFEYFYDVIAGSIQENAAAQAALAKALEEGMIVVSAIVYAELAGRFASREVLNSFLEVWRCRVEPLEVATAHLADIYFKAVSQTRRRPSADSAGLPDWGPCGLECGPHSHEGQEVLWRVVSGAAGGGSD